MCYRIDHQGFHPLPIHFANLKEEDILWHYLHTKSVIHMHHIFMYDDLIHKHQNLTRLLMAIRDEKNESKELSPKSSANPITVTPIWKLWFANGAFPIWFIVHYSL